MKRPARSASSKRKQDTGLFFRLRRVVQEPHHLKKGGGAGKIFFARGLFIAKIITWTALLALAVIVESALVIRAAQIEFASVTMRAEYKLIRNRERKPPPAFSGECDPGRSTQHRGRLGNGRTSGVSCEMISRFR